jgi:ribosomal protein S18 acetylase RimI-like enzyme
MQKVFTVEALPTLDGPAFETVPLKLDVTFRFCTEADVPLLEWFGLFEEHRNIFQDIFASQARGENLMLLAILNGLPVGQVWIDLKKRADESAGVIWALRVIPWLQGLKLGTRLLHAAEQLILEQGFGFAELDVDKSNPEALRLYERTGYRVLGESQENESYQRPNGEAVNHPVNRWVLRKKLQTTPKRVAKLKKRVPLSLAA